jgi:hypothetical protein
VALIAGVLIAAAPASAAWTTGSGSATASAPAPRGLVISQGASATQPLYPTGTPTGDVAVSITNPNPHRVRVGLALDPTGGTGGYSALAAGCGVQWSAPPDRWTIPAGATVDLDLRGTLTLPANAPDSCQGLAVFVYLKAVP